MKNKEKFANEIIELAITGRNVGFNKYTDEIFDCGCLICDDCLFKNNEYVNCDLNRKIWAEREYVKTKKIFSEIEKNFALLCDYINFYARDENGKLYGFREKPEKGKHSWRNGGFLVAIYSVTSARFLSIKWEDEQPTSRKEILGE